MSITFLGTDFSVPISMQELYSDNTPRIKTPDFDTICQKADTVVVKQGSLAEFVNAMFLVDSIALKGGKIRKLILPFLPGARQDRVNIDGDVLFTASSVAQMINLRGFEQVISVDPHSRVMPGFIYNFVEFPLAKVYEKLPKSYDGVIAPDKGAKARARTAARVLNKTVTYADKVRDPATGSLSGFAVNVDEDKHYIVIDDIADGGGTFLGLGEKIAEQGATADLYVTHAIFSKGTDDLKKIYKNIYTTNSINNGQRPLDVIRLDVVTEMEKY
jgi:ribose-phosphate pyrophosphokinase